LPFYKTNTETKILQRRKSYIIESLFKRANEIVTAINNKVQIGQTSDQQEINDKYGQTFLEYW
jgi:hypothetical protein